jgi:hypothetical protein
VISHAILITYMAIYIYIYIYLSTDAQLIAFPKEGKNVKLVDAIGLIDKSFFCGRRK